MDFLFKIKNREPLSDEDIINRYQKAQKIKKKVLIVAGVAIIIVMTGYHFLHPIYQQVEDNVYSVLANMDDSIFLRAGNTIIYDKDDKVIGKIGNEKYEYVALKNISNYVQKGYIAKEDQSFTTNSGVDWKATARASLMLIKNKGHITQGGSTITQQVVKNNLLSQEKSYIRKFSEIVLARKIAKDYTKEQIMEFYCNSNYYGNGCYGIEGASQYYFGKKSSELTLGEAAILVATSNSPNNYNPVANYDLSMKKKKEVLNDMLECNYITQEEYNAAEKERPDIVKKSENVENNSYLVTYAVHCAALDVMKDDGFDFKYTFSSSEEYKKYSQKYDESYNNALTQVRTGGYSIHTSLDPEAQKLLQQSVDSGLSEFKDQDDKGIYKLQGAAVSIDNTTGMVVAIVGGREEKGDFNRGYQAKRQPGSCIKPLLDYGPALNEGTITAGTVLTDKKTTISGYSPTNANNNYRGNVSIREAVIRSLNTIALQTLNKTSLSVSMEYLNKMHFSTLTYADSTALATSIGGFTDGLTVVDMAKGYATLADNGKYTQNDCIRKLERYDGDIVYQLTDKKSQVFTEDTSFILSNIMEGLFKESYGAGYGKDTKGQFYAGKTGSTNSRKDAWFCGYSTHYTTSVWVGFDTPKDLGFYGSSYPMNIWLDYMNNVSTTFNLTAQDFAIPSTVKLQDSGGNTQDVTYNTNIYESKPAGWDYISSLAMKKIEEHRLAEEEDARYQKALKAVGSFEKYQITSMGEAKSLQADYNQVYSLADAVTDATHRKDLMDRIAYKYELLNSDVINTWNAVIAEYDKKTKEEQDANNKLQAQESLEKAQKRLKKYRIELVQYYIDCLNARSVYTSYIDELIAQGQSALQDCKDYTEYTNLSDSLNKAIEYAKALPVEDNSQIPVIPSTSPQDSTTETEDSESEP